MMRAPLQVDRRSLDEAIAALVRLGDDVTLDDFRTETMAAARRTNQRLRIIALYGEIIFFIATIATFSLRVDGASNTALNNLWLGFSMGGLGAVTSLLVTILKLAPEDPFKAANEFDAVARILLGCAFSTVLTYALLGGLDAPAAGTTSSRGPPPASSMKAALALAPFLFGYSTELALRVLERMTQSLMIFFGGDDRRQTPGPRRGQKRRLKSS